MRFGALSLVNVYMRERERERESGNLRERGIAVLGVGLKERGCENCCITKINVTLVTQGRPVKLK